MSVSTIPRNTGKTPYYGEFQNSHKDYVAQPSSGELLLLRRTLLHTSAQCGSNEPSHSSNRSVYTFLRTHSMPHHFGITAIFGGFHHGGAGPRRHPCGRVEELAEWLVAARCQWGYLGAVAPEEVRYAPRYRLMVCGLCRSPERHRLESRWV